MARDLMAEYEALDAAINRGLRACRYQDRYEEYRSLEEMERIRGRLRRQLGLDGPPVTDVVVEFDKGTRPHIASSSGTTGEWLP